MPRLIDLSGKVFGRLTVIREDGRDKHGQKLWLCKCECGNETHVRTGNLRSGGTSSCGCLASELSSNRMKKRLIKHGRTNTPEYKTWQSMKSRCYNPKFPYYSDYGGRGIEVCNRWNESFKNFLDDMGEKPTPDYTIERIDNDKGYFPDNCVWASKTAQSRNQRVRKTSKTGIRGVTKIKQSQLYRARINVNGKEVHLGVFEDLKEAAFARKQAELLYWGVVL